MPVKLSRALRDKLNATGAASAAREYEDRFKAGQRGDEPGSQAAINNYYYDLVTDFFEYGWGRSFHFAPREAGESFRSSLARHERRLAHVLELKPGMVVADIGSGVGGPLMEIARYSGSHIVGINSNAYQIERARKYVGEAGLSDLADFLHCDFLKVDAEDESFDAAYSIEATCCSPDKPSVYGEIFRLLKPGACFAAYEYCMTGPYDARNPLHLKLKADIELGGGLLDIDELATLELALRTVGFEVLEMRDLAVASGPDIPWYQPLAGSGLSFASFRSSRTGRWLTRNTLVGLETLRIAPAGAAEVADKLNLCAAAMAEAGRLGIFTPMYFIHARKPD